MHIIFLMEVNLCHIFQKMANVCLGNKPSINTNHNGMIISTRGHTEYSSVILKSFSYNWWEMTNVLLLLESSMYIAYWLHFLAEKSFFLEDGPIEMQPNTFQ